MKPDFAKFRSWGFKVDHFEIWNEHLEGCDTCITAIYFTQTHKPKEISMQCCEVGKPLYLN